MTKLDTGVTTTTTTKKGIERINVTSPYFKEQNREEKLILAMLYFSVSALTITLLGMLTFIGYLLFN